MASAKQQSRTTLRGAPVMLIVPDFPPVTGSFFEAMFKTIGIGLGIQMVKGVAKAFVEFSEKIEAESSRKKARQFRGNQVLHTGV